MGNWDSLQTRIKDLQMLLVKISILQEEEIKQMRRYKESQWALLFLKGQSCVWKGEKNK